MPNDIELHAIGPDPVEAFFARLYRRTGGRYLDAILALVVVFAVFIAAPGYTALLFPLLQDLSTEQYLRYVLGYVLTTGVIGSVITTVILHRRLAGAVAWTRGARDAEAAERAWHTISELPRAIAAAVAVYCICTIPSGTYVAHEESFAWYGYPVYLLTLFALIGVVGVFGLLLFEQAARPIVREAAAALPPSVGLPAGAVSLATKMLLVVPAIVFVTAIVLAAAAREQASLSAEAFLATMLGSGAILLATLTAALLLSFRHTLLQRIHELRRAMVSVERGDLDVHVPVLAGDEIDEIGTTLNWMVVGLREREELREHNVQQAEELRRSRARIVAAHDAERRRMERDLHDGAQQHLVLLRLKLGMAARLIDKDPDAARALQDEMLEDTDRALGALRDLAHGIYPAVLESDGLAAALRDAAQRAPLPTAVECDGAGRYARELEAAVYFCCLEALQNAGKHAGEGARAEVTLGERAGQLEFRVTDDGVGLAGEATGHGLQGMVDRIGALGGHLRVESAPGRGTAVIGEVPVRANASGGAR